MKRLLRRAVKNFYNIRFIKSLASSLRVKLLVFFLILSFFPVMATGFLSFRISSSIVYEMAEESSIEIIERIYKELSSLFSDIIYFIYHIQRFSSLKQGVIEDFQNIEERYLTDFSVSSELQFISEYKKEIFGIYILGDNKSKFKSNYYTFKEDDLRNTSWYSDVHDSEKLLTFGPYNDSLAVKTVSNWGLSFFSFGIPYIDGFTGEKKGIILAEFEKKLLEDVISSTLGKTGYILLLDKDNNILLSPENYDENINFDSIPVSDTVNFKSLIINQRFLNVESTSKVISLLDNKHIMFYKNIDIPNWKVVGIIPYRELRTDQNNSIWFIILFAIISSIISGIVSVNLSSNIVKPIIRLKDLMKEVESGNLKVVTTNERSDEIGLLSLRFNNMIDKLQKSMEQIYEDQSKIRKAELQLLQAQINPHFLYNTLDSIKYLAKRNENQAVVKMVVSLARFFRSNLSKGRAIISLKEELGRIENYLTILRIRYRDKFSYEINLPLQFSNCRILKLSLQPIVENAIYHGIKEQSGKGFISINIKQEEGNLLIEVEDTGKGISKDKLNELVNKINDQSGLEDRSYGLRNVQERIHIYFGSGYGLSFREREGGATIVCMTLPFEMEDIFDKSHNS